MSNDVQAIGIFPLDSRQPGYIANASLESLKAPGPSVHLPGHHLQLNLSPLLHPQRKNLRLAGYTPEHAHYPIVRQKHIQEAYSTNNGEVVVVEVRVVIKLPGRITTNLVHVCLT